MKQASWLLCSIVVISAIILPATLVYGQSADNSSAPFVQTASPMIDGLTLFAGVGAGFTRVSGEGFDGALTGRNVAAFGLLSPRRGRWFFDIGGGWSQSRVKGTTSQDEKVDMLTQSPFIEFSPNFLLGEHWHIGALVTALFGADHRYGAEVESSNQVVLWGPRVSYEWSPTEFWRARAFAQVLGETTIANRQFTEATIGIVVGLPLGAHERATIASQTPAKEDVTLQLDPELVFFRTASASIKPELQELLDRAFKTLSDEGIEWESIEVSGHADQRGSKEFNEKLSQRRAQAVQDQLVASGLEQAKIKLQFFGKSQLKNPQNNPAAWAENRRVEVIFRGVKDPKRLRALLEPIQQFQKRTFGH